MTELARLISSHELLLLFAVILSGLALGRLELRGVRLGAAGVLFAGLGLSAWLRPIAKLDLAPQLKEFGLVLFVYCVGISSGPGFFSSWRRGMRLNLAVACALLAGAALAWLGGRTFGLDRGEIAGVFCGALTNTPALGAASERLRGTALESHPALGYSATYPFGVMGALLLARLLAKRRARELEAEVQQQTSARAAIESKNLKVTNTEVIGRSIGELRIRDEFKVVISRMRSRGQDLVPTKYTQLALGDLITIVGTRQALEAAVCHLGVESSERLDSRRDRVDMRRVLVSRHDLVGRSLGELDLARRFNAQVTRLRRADVDIVPSDEMRLELGDRLRVVAPVERMHELARHFGDSERELAEVDYVALALGLCAGLMLAQLPLPVLGAPLTLGSAGGPLLAALLLGRLGRTGSLVWAMPYEASLTLRELGLLLFLAGVGVSAGSRLDAVMNREGLSIVALGIGVTLLTTLVVMFVGRRFGKASITTTLGSASGLQTQPATLAQPSSSRGAPKRLTSRMRSFTRWR